MSKPVIVWRFTDGKPGHENQTKGLVQAMASSLELESSKISANLGFFPFFALFISGRFYRELSRLPKPDYLIAAGRRTHLVMLIAAYLFGGKKIVLMRSFWPSSWFDRMLIPQHDNPKKAATILATQGVLNTVLPSKQHLTNKALILIGGPSRHYHWDTNKLIEQIAELIAHSPTMSWTIANSRRSPADFAEKLIAITDNYLFIDHQKTDSDWLAKQLALAGQVWVSPDSVSMLYEAVTSGAAVGCFDLEQKKNDNRIVRGINSLIEDSMITPFGYWQQTHKLNVPSRQLNEAQRAANWILNND